MQSEFLVARTGPNSLGIADYAARIEPMLYDNMIDSNTVYRYFNMMYSSLVTGAKQRMIESHIN